MHNLQTSPKELFCQSSGITYQTRSQARKRHQPRQYGWNYALTLSQSACRIKFKKISETELTASVVKKDQKHTRD